MFIILYFRTSLPETSRLDVNRSIERSFSRPINDKQEAIENRLSNQLPSDDTFLNVSTTFRRWSVAFSFNWNVVGTRDEVAKSSWKSIW